MSPSKETGSLAAQPKTTKPSPWWSGWTGAAANDSASLDSRLRALALFSILFFGLVLLALTGRRLMRNHRILSTPDNVIRMQTLSDLTLAPKQKLTLVQVGNERLLLAVSPDGVSLITHLPGNEAPAPSEKPRVVEPARLSASRPGPSAASELKRAPSPTPSELEPAVREARTSNPRRLASSPAATPSPRPAAPASSERADSPRRINYAIDDEGVHEQTLEATPKLRRDPSTEKAIDDVTKLIREKLKSLPKIS